MSGTEMKCFEDLKFQQQKKENSQAEEKVTWLQQLQREISEYQHILVSRKVCGCVDGRLREDIKKKLFLLFVKYILFTENQQHC